MEEETRRDYVSRWGHAFGEVHDRPAAGMQGDAAPMARKRREAVVIARKDREK
jgi:hypothetical protein